MGHLPVCVHHWSWKWQTLPLRSRVVACHSVVDNACPRRLGQWLSTLPLWDGSGMGPRWRVYTIGLTMFGLNRKGEFQGTESLVQALLALRVGGARG